MTNWTQWNREVNALMAEIKRHRHQVDNIVERHSGPKVNQVTRLDYEEEFKREGALDRMSDYERNHWLRGVSDKDF